MKRFALRKTYIILMVFMLFIVPKTSYSEVAVDGYTVEQFSLLGYDGLTAAPAVSGASAAMTYYNASDDMVYLSTNEGAYAEFGGSSSVEGTAVLSTGEGGATKYLREDGDGTSSWQAISGGGVTLGLIKGLVVGYSDTNTVTITSGYADCNGTMYYQAAATTHDISSGAQYQQVYIFIDDSASTANSIVFRSEDSGVETPALNETLQGIYSDQTVADRMVGAMYCEGAATMRFCTTQDKGGGEISVVPDNTIALGTSQNPTGAYMAPDERNGSDVLPSTAVKVGLYGWGNDANAACAVFFQNKECADNEANEDVNCQHRDKIYTGWVWTQGWVELGPSNDVMYAGEDNDDDGTFNLSIFAWTYIR